MHSLLPVIAVLEIWWRREEALGSKKRNPLGRGLSARLKVLNVSRLVWSDAQSYSGSLMVNVDKIG